MIMRWFDLKFGKICPFRRGDFDWVQPLAWLVFWGWFFGVPRADGSQTKGGQCATCSLPVRPLQWNYSSLSLKSSASCERCPLLVA